jgi:hypothetical protein
MKIHDLKSTAALRLATVFLCVCGVFLCATLHYAAFHHNSVFPVAARHRGSRFVFADLDGDRKPDMALVETQRQRSNNCDYAVRVRLSAGADSAIGVIGPSGGLRVAVRDVNGDSNLDLIITADLDAGFVEVLLNDGHGNFSLVAPTDFLRKENQIQDAVRVPGDLPSDHGVVAAMSSSRGETDLPPSVSDEALSDEPFSRSVLRPSLTRITLSRSGRSPPAGFSPS